MHVLVQQAKRQWLGTLLLAAATAFACCCFAACRTAKSRRQQLEAGHTTIALANGLTVGEYAALRASGDIYGLENTDGSIRWLSRSDRQLVKTTYSVQQLFDMAANALQVQSAAHSGLLAARLGNGSCMTTGSKKKELYQPFFDAYAHSFCVLAVRCISVENNNSTVPVYRSAVDSAGKLTHQYQSSFWEYTARFEILAAPALAPAYRDEAQIIEIGGNFSVSPYTAAGKCPFEAGKSYLVRGFWQAEEYEPYRSVDGTVTLRQKDGVPHVSYSNSYATHLLSSMMGKYPEFLLNLREIGEKPEPSAGEDEEEDELCWYTYYALPENALPFCTEYTGDWQSFLESPKGAVWRDTILPWVQNSQNLVQVVLTDDVMTTYNFNTSAAGILDGRLITAQEYALGADVCLISATLAEHNGWQVGDTVELDYYRTSLQLSDVTTTRYDEGDSTPSSSRARSWQRLPSSPSERIGLQKSYTHRWHLYRAGICVRSTEFYGRYRFCAKGVGAGK